MARKRDDAAGERPDDETFDDAVAADSAEPADDDVEPVADDETAEDELAEDGELVGRGGTALRERKAGAGNPKAKKDVQRTGFFGRIGNFFREIVSELRKVIWPTRRELLTYTAVVIVFLVIMTTIVGVLDYAFAKGILFGFGSK